MNVWNKLDEDVVFEPSINILKHKLNKLYMDELFPWLGMSAWLRGPSQAPGEIHIGELLPNTVAGFQGHFKAEREGGMGRKGGRKGKDEGKGQYTLQNNFLVMALVVSICFCVIG